MLKFLIFFEGGNSKKIMKLKTVILRSSSPLFPQIVKRNKNRTLFEKNIVA